MNNGKTKEVEGPTLLKPAKDLFTDDVCYRQNRLIKTFARYNDDVARKLRRITKKRAVQMRFKTSDRRVLYRS